MEAAEETARPQARPNNIMTSHYQIALNTVAQNPALAKAIAEAKIPLTYDPGPAVEPANATPPSGPTVAKVAPRAKGPKVRRARVRTAKPTPPAAKAAPKASNAKDSTDDRLAALVASVNGGASQFATLSAALKLPRGALRGLIEKAKERRLIFMAGKLGGAHYGVSQAQADERAGKHAAADPVKDARPVGPVAKRARRTVHREPAGGGE